MWIICSTPSLVDNNGCSMTKNDAILFLKQNGINCLYHFTDRRNLPSIKKLGGLYSWQWLDTNNIRYLYSDYSDSHRMDNARNLQNYVRLSFCKTHPMAYRKWADSKNSGDSTSDRFDPVLLEIELDILDDNVLISDKNAVDNNAIIKPGFSSLNLVNFEAVKMDTCESSNPNFKNRQAEVLIPTRVPIEYIINVDSPIEFDFNDLNPNYNDLDPELVKLLGLD